MCGDFGGRSPACALYDACFVCVKESCGALRCGHGDGGGGGGATGGVGLNDDASAGENLAPGLGDGGTGTDSREGRSVHDGGHPMRRGEWVVLLEKMWVVQLRGGLCDWL